MKVIDGLTYNREYCLTQEQKYEIGQFIFDNTETFVLNTFMYLWESRDWWKSQPIDTCRDQDGKLVGIKINAEKKEIDTLKSYYSVIRKDYREKHIFSRLLLESLYDHDCKYIIVTCTVGRDGERFYGRLLDGKKSCKTEYKTSEFGDTDVVFTIELKDMISLLEARINN